MGITTLPYFWGYLTQGPFWRFTGFVFGIEDGNSYIAKMLSGSAGAWLFRTPYTAQPQSGVVAFLPYILLGKLAAPPGEHEQLVALFHLFRFIAGVLAILATYDFLSLFVRDKRLLRWGLALATIGGGLGWLLVLLGADHWLGSLPLDFYSPETFGFLALYGLPHLALARAFLLWGLVIYLNPAKFPGLPFLQTSRSYLDFGGILTGILWFLMGFAQPLTVAIAWLVLALHLGAWGAWLFWRTRRLGGEAWLTWRVFFRRAFWIVLVSAPIVIYTVLAFSWDPFLRTWTGQNLILSPHPLHYLLAYGLILPFAIGGAVRLLREDPVLGWLPAAWGLALPVLVYAPFNLQRRLSEGLWVALVALALCLFRNFRDGRAERSGLRLFQGATLLLFPSTLFLLVGGAGVAAQPALPAFRPVEEISAFETLASASLPGEVVLAAYDTGNALPAWTSLRVVIGHGPESADLAELRPLVEGFYQTGTSDEQRLSLLQRFHVRYVFWGPEERLLGDWDPAQAGYLESLARAGGYQVFKVIQPSE